MPPTILALDVSLTSTGVALPTGVTGRITPTSRGVHRLAYIRDAILDLTDTWRPDLTVIEGYSYGSRATQAHSTGELGGVLRLALFEAGHRWIDVPPATVKKYATGKGNAEKDAVLAAAIRRLDYQGSKHDEADALWIRALTLDAAGHPVADVPQVHRDAIVKPSKNRPSVVDQVADTLATAA